MYKLLFLLFPALFACNASNENEESRAPGDSTTAVTVDAPAEMRADKVSSPELPETLGFEGEVKDAYRWTDSNGDNYFFITVKGPYPDNDKGEAEEEGRSADIYAYHYAKNDETDYRLLWKMHDQEISCPFDITTELVPSSLTVTDLDRNGIGEVKFQYAMACRSDVSPAAMKLVMEENARVYSLTGNRWVEFSPDFKFDVNSSNVNLEKLPMLDDGEDDLLRSYGRYKSEKEFQSAPQAFLEYARNEWIKYAIEKFSN